MNKDALTKTFQKAKELNAVKPWQWMSDLDIFAIKLDALDDPAFISILGQVGELNGVTMYTDPVGLLGLFEMFSNPDLDEFSALHNQKCIALYFNNRNELSPDEYSLIKQSGVSFRGKYAWPTFVTYEPGYLPNTSKEDIYEFMPELLDKIIDCCEFFQDNMDKAGLMQFGKYYLREYQDNNTFLDKIMSYEDYFYTTNEEIEIYESYDDFEIHKLKKQGKRIMATWEIDTFYHFIPVEDDDEPFFPAVSLIIDLHNQMILDSHLSHPEFKYTETQRNLLDLMLKDEILPIQINVSDTYLYAHLEDLCDLLGIKINLVEELTEAPMAKEEFFDFFT